MHLFPPLCVCIKMWCHLNPKKGTKNTQQHSHRDIATDSGGRRKQEEEEAKIKDALKISKEQWMQVRRKQHTNRGRRKSKCKCTVRWQLTKYTQIVGESSSSCEQFTVCLLLSSTFFILSLFTSLSSGLFVHLAALHLLLLTRLIYSFSLTHRPLFDFVFAASRFIYFSSSRCHLCFSLHQILFALFWQIGWRQDGCVVQKLSSRWLASSSWFHQCAHPHGPRHPQVWWERRREKKWWIRRRRKESECDYRWAAGNTMEKMCNITITEWVTKIFLNFSPSHLSRLAKEKSDTSCGRCRRSSWLSQLLCWWWTNNTSVNQLFVLFSVSVTMQVFSFSLADVGKCQWIERSPASDQVHKSNWCNKKRRETSWSR